MTRFEAVCSALEKCSSFADIGCDHGYYTEYMLKNGLCDTALISDISAPSLKKAEILLKDYIAAGTVKSACADGLKAADKDTSLALIAGMGGMEIIKILSEGFIPEKFVLQPMKDSPRLREFLIGRGAKITLDATFFGGGYFYDVIKGERGGGDVYTPDELTYGRDNLKNPSADFLKKLGAEEEKILEYLSGAEKESSAAPLEKKLNDIKRIKKRCAEKRNSRQRMY